MHVSLTDGPNFPCKWIGYMHFCNGGMAGGYVLWATSLALFVGKSVSTLQQGKTWRPKVVIPEFTWSQWPHEYSMGLTFSLLPCCGLNLTNLVLIPEMLFGICHRFHKLAWLNDRLIFRSSRTYYTACRMFKTASIIQKVEFDFVQYWRMMTHRNNTDTLSLFIWIHFIWS